MDAAVYPSPAEVAQAVADKIVAGLQTAVHERGHAYLNLAGGSTFQTVYRLLATPEYQAALDWSQVDFYFGDERQVALTDPLSNYRAAYEAWLHLYQDSPHVHSLQEIASSGVELPIFDITLLGVGPDGHTASIFPGSLEVVLKVTEPVVETMGELEPKIPRLTMTPATLNRSRLIVLAVTGENKAAIVPEIFADKAHTYPVSYIKAEYGPTEWLLDEAAASQWKNVK